MEKSKSIVIVSMSIILMTIVLSLVYVQKLNQTKKSNPITVNNNNASQTNNNPKELQPIIAGWKIYENKEYGFRIDYPSDWRVRETPEYSDLKINAVSLVSPEVLNIDNFANERIKNFNSSDLDNFFTYNSDISIFRYTPSNFETKYGVKTIEELTKINDGTIKDIGKIQIGGIEATDFVSIGDDYYYNIMFENKGFFYDIFFARAAKNNIPYTEKQILSSFQLIK